MPLPPRPIVDTRRDQMFPVLDPDARRILTKLREFGRLGPSPWLYSAASLAGGPSSNGTSSPAICCSERPAMPCRSP
jgi:hypothetical protein